MWTCLDCDASFGNRRTAEVHGDETGHTVQGEWKRIFEPLTVARTAELTGNQVEGKPGGAT